MKTPRRSPAHQSPISSPTVSPNDAATTQADIRLKTPPKALINGYLTTNGKWVFVRQVDEQNYMWTLVELTDQHRYVFRDLEPWNHQWMNFKDVSELCQRHHIGILGHEDIVKTIKNFVENVNMTEDEHIRRKCALYVDALIFLFGKDGWNKIESIYQAASDKFYERFFDKHWKSHSTSSA